MRHRAWSWGNREQVRCIPVWSWLLRVNRCRHTLVDAAALRHVHFYSSTHSSLKFVALGTLILPRFITVTLEASYPVHLGASKSQPRENMRAGWGTEWGAGWGRSRELSSLDASLRPFWASRPASPIQELEH